MTDAIRTWDRHIHAFVALSDAPGGTGPLSGLTVGVKDIIDVAGLPTRNGSAACENAAPADQDATVVKRLRDAGARVVGKTTTTEFAFTDPTPCRNPYDLARSPGGSSSGSGAAVGAGVLDLALGTQTAGSLIRPAAYCGAVGYKPSAGLFPLDGVTPLARSFDTVGVIARDVSLARRAFDVLVPDGGSESTGRPRAICGLWNGDVPVAPDWQRALDDAGAAMGDLAHVIPSRLPVDVDRIVAAHRSIMCAEAFAAHQALLRERGELLRPKFRAGLEAGRDAQGGGIEARRVLDDARHAFWGAMKDTDLILTLPVPDGAPRIDCTTGFQDWLTPWTVMGGPLICVPWGLDSLSRPRSVMLVAHPGQDQFLLEMAARLEKYAPDLPPPQLPL